jgi:hypothetical protein
MMFDSPSAHWRKGSRSSQNADQCVEVASLDTVSWRKSSRSGSSGDVCVEVANLDIAVGVRDSKNPEGPKLVFSCSEWSAFAERIRSGRLDLT